MVSARHRLPLVCEEEKFVRLLLLFLGRVFVFRFGWLFLVKFFERKMIPKWSVCFAYYKFVLHTAYYTVSAGCSMLDAGCWMRPSKGRNG